MGSAELPQEVETLFGLRSYGAGGPETKKNKLEHQVQYQGHKSPKHSSGGQTGGDSTGVQGETAQVADLDSKEAKFKIRGRTRRLIAQGSKAK